jgi:hypothetical protein
MSGAGIRPDWRKLGRKWNRQARDYSLAPAHEVADNVEPEPVIPGGPPVAQPLVTGITSEYPTSEIIYSVEGDLIVAVTP